MAGSDAKANYSRDEDSQRKQSSTRLQEQDSVDGQKNRVWARAAFCSVLASVFTDASCVFARAGLGTL